MKHGKGPGDIIGFTTKPKTLEIWAKSQHTCTQILKEVSDLTETQLSSKVVYKEESQARIASDEIDRKKIRNFISLCINPLDLNSHNPSTLCNIYTCEVTDKTTNVNKSVEIGR